MESQLRTLTADLLEQELKPVQECRSGLLITLCFGNSPIPVGGLRLDVTKLVRATQSDPEGCIIWSKSNQIDGFTSTSEFEDESPHIKESARRIFEYLHKKIKDSPKIFYTRRILSEGFYSPEDTIQVCFERQEASPRPHSNDYMCYDMPGGC